MAKEIASVLSYEKKLAPSDGYMYGTRWDDRTVETELVLQEKSVRGTISNREKAVVKNDPAKLNAKVESPNLQTVDTCSLAPDQDTLKLYFTLKVLGGIHKPSACNNASFKQSYAKAASDYVAKNGFLTLAKRYATNIASGRYLWRNRVGAEAIEVQVKVLSGDSDQTWVFNGRDFSLQHFDNSYPDVDAMAQHIAKALASEDGHLLLGITCYAKVGQAQEVYPSEELVMDKGKGEKSKILYSYGGTARKAAMHSQKLGNAIRTIDTWYPDFNNPEQSAGPIAIEPYGAVTNLGRAYRTPKEKQDFYTFFDSWAVGGKLDHPDHEHYVMAVLVRGGVFGLSDK